MMIRVQDAAGVTGGAHGTSTADSGADVREFLSQEVRCVSRTGIPVEVGKAPIQARTAQAERVPLNDNDTRLSFAGACSKKTPTRGTSSADILGVR